MFKNIARLLKIQELEKELLALEEAKGQLPLSIEKYRERISAAEQDLKAVAEEIKKLQVEKMEMELESSSKLEEIAKYDKQLMVIKTNVEYKALQKEIANLKVENSRIEDKILELMEMVEEREQHKKSSEETVNKERERFSAEEKRVRGEVEGMNRKIAELESERDKLLPGVSEPVLRKYQRIFRYKRGTAIVPLSNYICGGCHMRLPPQAANNVRKSNELVICENCSRILYWPEGIKEITESAPEGESCQPTPSGDDD